ncbi:MAG: alpha/beta fold hydrolase [Gammaproteobacteria bacterium]|jgi:4,5:9,10-diseco-3-hydroxy-5,9,17-trioxoandrosta-1(10),2-diene-4-oate hydrolase
MPRDKYITIDNIKVHYWDEGDSNIPIILVHGINANVSFWHKNFSALAKTHRVIALDLLGFGDTDKPHVKYNVTMLAQFLGDFLRGLQIKRCYLVGHSLGGAVSLQFALWFPNVVEKLILVSPVGFTHKLPLIVRLGTLPFICQLIKYISKKLITKVIYLYVYDKKCITKEFLQNNYRIAQLPGVRRVLISLLRQNIDIHGIKKEIIEPVMENLSQLTMPVLIIWGKNDKLLPVKNTQAALRLIPQAKLEIFDKCGHIPQLEHPEKFNQLVKSFVGV